MYIYIRGLFLDYKYDKPRHVRLLIGYDLLLYCLVKIFLAIPISLSSFRPFFSLCNSLPYWDNHYGLISGCLFQIGKWLSVMVDIRFQFPIVLDPYTQLILGFLILKINFCSIIFNQSPDNCFIGLIRCPEPCECYITSMHNC